MSLYHPHGLRAKLIPRINKMAAALLAGLITATAALSSAQAQGHKTNTSAGLEAGANVTSGKKNTANGAYALQKNKAGNNNTAVGNQALKLNQAGSKNTAVGNQALKKNTGSSNVAIGNAALKKNTSGQFNLGIGVGALLDNETGNNNVALGMDAGAATDGSDNILIDNIGVAGESGIIRIGADGIHTKTYLAGKIIGDGSGLTGITGPAGETGATGATGATGPAGTNGTDGAQGPAGTDGTNGTDGAQGPAGTDGTGVASAAYNAQGELVLTLTDDSTINAGVIPQRANVDDNFTGFIMDFVFVGNTTNVDDDTNYGAVPYSYRVGKYEVSEAMIDAYNTANPSILITKDTRGADKPATSVSWNEAARFVNWLNTSQGYQAAYKFDTDGFNDNIALWTPAEAWQQGGENLYRHKDAKYFLPSEDEWYKAAYYDPNKGGAGVGGYWDYATGSDTGTNSSSQRHRSWHGSLRRASRPSRHHQRGRPKPLWHHGAERQRMGMV